MELALIDSDVCICYWGTDLWFQFTFCFLTRTYSTVIHTNQGLKTGWPLIYTCEGLLLSHTQGSFHKIHTKLCDL